MPTIEQIRFILEIAKTGSVNQAAKNLYTSQPYLSKILKNVEEELNVTLFERKHHGMTPTVQGDIFIQYAEQILTLTQNMTTLQYEQPQKSPYLRVGSTYALIMHEIFRQFREQNQKENWQLSFSEYPNRTIPEMLRAKQIDIGILFLNPEFKKDMLRFFATNHLEFHPLFQDSVCILVGKKNPLFQKERIDLEELLPYYFVSTKNALSPEHFLQNYIIKRDPLFFEDGHTLNYYISNSKSFTFGLPILNMNDFLLKEHRLKYLHIKDYQSKVEIGYLFRKESEENELFLQYITFLQNFFNQLKVSL